MSTGKITDQYKTAPDFKLFVRYTHIRIKDRSLEIVTSKDGTTIAFDKTGHGPALILVGGSFEQRAMHSETSQLAAHPSLSEHFTVFHYDRRGRGNSTDTQPYAVAREVEDIEALINEAGGSVFLSGISSGAILAMEAAINLGSKVKKLAMYEPPYNYSDGDTEQALKRFKKHFSDALAEGRRGDAVAHFLAMLGLPAEQLDEMRQLPMWPMWESIAPTFGYEAALMGDDASVPTERAALIAVPTLIIDGSASSSSMRTAANTLANAIRKAQRLTLEGQTHQVSADALAPVLVQFFNSDTN